MLNISSAPQSPLIEFRVFKSRHSSPAPFYAEAYFKYEPPSDSNATGVGAEPVPGDTPESRVGAGSPRPGVAQTTAHKSEIENRKSQIQNPSVFAGEIKSPNRIWLAPVDAESVTLDNPNTSVLILKLLRDLGKASFQDLVENMPLNSPGTIRNTLHRLIHDGKVIRPDGGGRGKKATFCLKADNGASNNVQRA